VSSPVTFGAVSRSMTASTPSPAPVATAGQVTDLSRVARRLPSAAQYRNPLNRASNAHTVSISVHASRSLVAEALPVGSVSNSRTKRVLTDGSAVQPRPVAGPPGRNPVRCPPLRPGRTTTDSLARGSPPNSSVGSNTTPTKLIYFCLFLAHTILLMNVSPRIDRSRRRSVRVGYPIPTGRGGDARCYQSDRRSRM